MVDIATLGLEVKSDGVATANTRLNQLQKESKGAEEATTKLSSSFDGLSRYIQAAVAAIAAWKLTKYIEEATLLAARVETLGVVMKVVGNNAGYTGSQMEAYQKQVAKMGITTQESMSSLIKMAGAQMDLSKAAQLARVAQDAAVIGGINSSEAFGRMIQGIRSGETEILKTIGITVQFDQVYKQTAATLGKNADQLSAYEKTQARMNAVLDFGKNIAGAYEASMGTAGKQINSMSRYTEELKLKIGQLFTPALAQIVGEITRNLKEMDGQLGDNADNISVTSVQIRTAIVNVEAEFVRLAMLIDKAAGSITTFNYGFYRTLELGTRLLTVGQFGDGFKRLAEDADRYNKGYAERYKANEKELERLAGTLTPPPNGRTPEQEQAALAAATAEKARKEAEDRKAAAAAGAKAAEDWRKTYADLRDEIAKLNPYLSDLDKKLLDINNKYRDLENKKGANVGLLEKMRQQEVDAATTADRVKHVREYEDEILAASQQAIEDRRRSEGDAATRYLANRIAFYDAWTENEKRGAEKFLREQAMAEDKIKRQLFAVDLSEATYGISTSDALAQRYALYQQLLERQQHRLAGISPMDLQNWQTQMDKIDQTRMKLVELQKTMQDRTAWGGAIAGLHDYAEEAMNLGEQIRDAVTQSLDGLEDALTDFITKGKLDFKSLADSIISDLARIAVRQNITGPLSAGLGGLFGGDNSVGAQLDGTANLGVSAAASNFLPLAAGLTAAATAATMLFSAFSAGREEMERAKAAANAYVAQLKSVNEELAIRKLKATGDTFSADLKEFLDKQAKERKDAKDALTAILTNARDLPDDLLASVVTEYQKHVTSMASTQQAELTRFIADITDQADRLANSFFSDTEKKARDLALAQKSVDSIFASVGMSTPTTQAAMAATVASWANASDSIVKLKAALGNMNISTSNETLTSDLIYGANAYTKGKFSTAAPGQQQLLDLLQALGLDQRSATFAEQIALLEQQARAFEQVNNASDDMTTVVDNLAESMKRAADATKTLQEIMDSLTMGPNSTLSPQAQYEAAKAKFQADADLALSGNQDAFNALKTDVSAFSAASKGYYASGQGFQVDNAYMIATINAINAALGASPLTGVPFQAHTGMGNMHAATADSYGAQVVAVEAPETVGTLKQAVTELQALVRMQPATTKAIVDSVEDLLGQVKDIASAVRQAVLAA